MLPDSPDSGGHTMGVHTFESMGTVVSVRLRVPEGATDDKTEDSRESLAISAAHDVFDDFNERFSLYLETSELSQLALGDVLLAASSLRMRDAYAQALLWREKTNGAFTPHRPDGTLDLSGTIKAQAIADAADALESFGFESFSINAGGDILTRGSSSDHLSEDGASADGQHYGSWVTGIVDPQNPAELLSVVELTPKFAAMATSGSAERGNHIWARPETTNDFLQATVIASDIITADVFATAIIAGGQETLDHLTANFEIAVLAVKQNGELLANARFRLLVAR
jgi:thiamine biosynthesis lipoprotein